MSKTTFHFIVLGLILVLAQVIVFNHIRLFTVAVPFVFIYLIIRLPLSMPTYQTLTVGFFLGLLIDIFADTPGLNAMACTVLAMCRRGVLRLCFNREEDLTDQEPAMRTLGTGPYLKYMVTMVLIYSTVIFLLESFTFFRPWHLLLSIASSTLLTAVLLLGVDSILSKRSEKRL